MSSNVKFDVIHYGAWWVGLDIIQRQFRLVKAGGLVCLLFGSLFVVKSQPGFNQFDSFGYDLLICQHSCALCSAVDILFDVLNMQSAYVGYIYTLD